MELGLETIDHVISRLLDRPRARVDPDRSIPTSLRDLDELLAGGLRTGQTTVAASRSGDGASTFALGLARSAALHHCLPTLVLARDTPESEVVMRLISAEAHIPLQHLRARQMSDNEERRLRGHEQRLTSAPLAVRAGRQAAGSLIDSGDAMTSTDSGIRLVVVDSIATLGTDARERVTTMAALARDRNFALVLVTGAHEPTDAPGHPALTDLRDHDAVVDLIDTVLMIERAEPPEAFVHAVKHRYGPTGSIRLALTQHCCAFSNFPEDS